MYILGAKKIVKPCPQNKIWVLFKISDKYPSLFIWEYPPSPPWGGWFNPHIFILFTLITSPTFSQPSIGGAEIKWNDPINLSQWASPEMTSKPDTKAYCTNKFLAISLCDCFKSVPCICIFFHFTQRKAVLGNFCNPNFNTKSLSLYRTRNSWK